MLQRERKATGNVADRDGETEVRKEKVKIYGGK